MRNTESARGTCPSPLPSTSIFETNKDQKFQFQTSRLLFFTDVQKLYGSEIPQFLPCMLQFLDNIWRLFFTNNIVGPSGKVRYLTLDLLKNFFLSTIRKKNTMDESLYLRLKAYQILNLPKNTMIGIFDTLVLVFQSFYK